MHGRSGVITRASSFSVTQGLPRVLVTSRLETVAAPGAGY
jgi:hypothetical protein